MENRHVAGLDSLSVICSREKDSAGSLGLGLPMSGCFDSTCSCSLQQLACYQVLRSY